MNMIQLRVAGVGLFFLFIFLSGFWLSHSGKSLNTIILTIHKLISVAAVIFLIVIIYRTNQISNLSTIELIAGVITGALFISTIISGGLLSTNKPMPDAVLKIHQITPYLTLLSTALTLYLLPGRP